MRIEFSKKTFKAAFNAVFSPKTYSRIASKTASVALKIFRSIRDFILFPFPPSNTTSHEPLRDSTSNSEQSAFSKSIKKMDDQSSIRYSTITSKNIYEKIFPKSSHSVGHDRLIETFDRGEINPDGNCCFYSLTFGLLQLVAKTPSEVRQELIKSFMEDIDAQIAELHTSPSSEVRNFIASFRTGESRDFIEAVLLAFSADEPDLNSQRLLKWVNSGQNRELIGALRYFSALCGLHKIAKDPELWETFKSVLPCGGNGIVADSVEDYINKICPYIPPEVSYGGNIEIEGFSTLFNLVVDIFNLVAIGDPVNAQLSTEEAVAKGHMTFSPDHPRNNGAPLLMIHDRIHYDVALPKEPISLCFNLPSSSNSNLMTSDSSSSSDMRT